LDYVLIFSRTYWALLGEVWSRPLPKFAALGFEPQAIGNKSISRILMALINRAMFDRVTE